MIVSFSPPTPVLPALRYLAGGLGCVLAIAAPTLAQSSSSPTTYPAEALLISSRAYTPPAGSQSSGGASTGGGVRGCGAEMLALAPAFTSPGQTFSERPTFVWYIGEVPTNRLNFTLFHQSAVGESEVFSQDMTAATPGYQSFTLPAEAEPLQVGETYRWVTTLYCEEASDDVMRWIEAGVTIVDPPLSLPLLDAVAPTPSQKALRFARSGYWYDALAQVYAGETADERALRQALILDVADLAETVNSSSADRWSDRLRALVETP
ncbi:MAG: DUF928 domain-containing protein [Leptolyngbya sp. SIOISBB]|nr:DUF928 domain-containing protein [Leptolyngbya sp. SIOISBB]